jgi:hypothetical protein
VVELRFSEKLSGASDAERIWQISVLKSFFASAPLLGHGLGSYALELKRSFDTPYAYEVQVLALFGQFGLIGVGLLALLLVNYYRKAFSFRKGVLLPQIAAAILLMDLLLAAFFNPLLLASMSAVGYSLVFLVALSTRNQPASFPPQERKAIDAAS